MSRSILLGCCILTTHRWQFSFSRLATTFNFPKQLRLTLRIEPPRKWKRPTRFYHAKPTGCSAQTFASAQNLKHSSLAGLEGQPLDPPSQEKVRPEALLKVLFSTDSATLESRG